MITYHLLQESHAVAEKPCDGTVIFQDGSRLPFCISSNQK